MNDLLEIANGDNLEIVLLDRVDSIIDKAIEADNPYHAAKQMQILIAAKELVGKTLAKFLYKLSHSWEKFSLSDQESFNEFTTNAIPTMSDNTRNTYINYWKHKEELPEDFAERPLREIIPVTNALSQGYAVDSDVWDDLEMTTNPSEVSKIVREKIKNKPPRKGSQILQIDMDNGDIASWRNGRRSAVGFLDVYSDDEDVISAIERIINNSGIIRK